MDKILAIEKGILSQQTIDKLEETGVIVIECKEPEKIKVLSFTDPMDLLSSSDIFMAALKAANHDNYSKAKFAEHLLSYCNAKTSQ